MAFPTDLSNVVDNTDDVMAAHVNNIETKLGIDDSAVATSIDYLLKNPSSSNPGHKHTLVDGATDLSKATGAEVTTGTEDAKFVTPKAIGDAGVNTRLSSKVITATRDMTAAGAPTDVAYTGVGFTPTSIICLVTIDGTFSLAIGVADSAKAAWTLCNASATAFYLNNYFAYISSVANNAQGARVKSYDADGFTITWWKIGSPTGTAKLTFLCFR